MKIKVKKKKQWNIVAVVLYFLAAYLGLNFLEPTVLLHILSVAFIIAGSYGIVCLSQKEKFLF